MFKAILLTISLLLIFSCAQKKSEPKVNIKKIGSLNYIEAVSDNPGLLAKYEGMEVTYKEIEKKSRVLQEIIEQEKTIYSALLYRMVVKKLDEKLEAKEELKESYDLAVYTTEPKEGLDNLLKRLKLNKSDRINVNFVEATEEQTVGQVVGQFDGEQFKLNDLNKNHVAYIELQTKKNDEYLRQVKGSLTRRILFNEAKKNGSSVQDFINKTIVKSPVSVTNGEVVEFMRSKNIVEEEMSEQLTTSFKNILIENKRNKVIGDYIKTNITKNPVEIFLKSPDLVFDVKTDWSPVLGSEQSKHSMYLFTNPNCTACAQVENNINQALSANNYDVKLHTFYFYPDWDREARLFSEASMCSYLQDKSKFWQYHTLISQSEEKVVESDLYQFAEQVSLDVEEFKSCVLQRKTQEIVDYHLKYTDYLGINSQPTLVIRGKIYPGTISAEKLIRIFSNDFIIEKETNLLSKIINYIKNIFA